MIAGVIVSGSGGHTRLVVRAIGPSLGSSGVTEALADPALEVRDASGALIAANDNWRDTQEAEIAKALLAPQDELESASVISAAPGVYTATVRGNGGATGIGLVEVYKLD
jgi:hypothetical protein